MGRARHLIVIFAFFGSILAPVSPHASAAPTSISFAFGGDHGANSSTAASLKKLDSSGVDFYLAIGDLDYRQVPTPAAWCDYVKSRLPTLGPEFPFQLLAGNHEENTISQHAACLPDRMGSTLRTAGSYPTEYYFDYPAADPLVRVIMISPALVLNAVHYDYPAGSSRYNWVADTIDNARSSQVPWVVVGMHKHCFTSGSQSCEIGAPLMNMLVSKKVDLVLQGHKHTYQRGKQLRLNSACPAAAGSFNANCIVDAGTDDIYSKGRGTIVVINGSFGMGSDSSPKEYFVRGFGGDGFTKFRVTAERIDAEFVNSTLAHTDAYSIVPNQPPVFAPLGDQDHREGQTVTVPVSAPDPEGLPVSYSASGLPPGLSINASTGAISGRITVGAVNGSPYSTQITATDGDGMAGKLNLLWIVRDLTAPDTPGNITITKHTTGVQLDWPDNVEADLAGYTLSRSISATGPFTPLNEALLTSSDYDDADAPAGVTSYYQLAAADLRGNISPPRTGSVHRSPIVFVGSTKARGSGMTMVLKKPAGTQPGDVLLTALSVRGSSDVIPPPGWTLVSNVTRAGSLSHQAVFRHTVAGGDGSSYTFRVSGRASAVGIMSAYRRANARPASSAAQANPASKLITAPSVTSKVADSVLVGFFGISCDASITPPAGMWERGAHVLSSGPLRATFLVADAVVGAQTVGARVANASKACDGLGQLVLLSPAP